MDDSSKVAAKDCAKSDPKSKMTKSGGDIIDIADTPDVAVWAKEIRRGGTDGVKEPSKVQSITTRSTTDGKMVDPANEKEVAAASMAGRGVPLTDEADISKGAR